jgi:membrane protein CcdC involved in cytochrome C biogenesis
MRNFRTNSSNISVFLFGLFEPLVFVTSKYEIQERTIYFDIIVDPFGLAYKTLSLSHRYAKGCQISINKTFHFGLFEPLVYVTRKYEIQEGTIYFDIIMDLFGLACKTLSLSHRYA